MKNFITQLILSISSTRYYYSVLYQKFWDIFRFYLLFLCCITFVMTLLYWWRTQPQLEGMLKDDLSQLSEHYPADLRIEWDAQKLTSSQDPVVIPFPENIKPESSEVAENLAVITNSVSDIPQIGSLFLISPEHVSVVDQGKVSRQIMLADLLGSDPIQLNKDTLPTISDQIVGIGKTLTTLVGYVFPLLYFVFLLLSRLYILLIETFIIFLLTKIQRMPFSYKQLFQLNMALFVPAEIIQLVTKLAQLDLPISMLTLSFWVLFVVVFFSLPKRSVTTA